MVYERYPVWFPIFPVLIFFIIKVALDVNLIKRALAKKYRQQF